MLGKAHLIVVERSANPACPTLPITSTNPKSHHAPLDNDFFPPVGAEDRSKAKETELLEDIIAEEEELFQDEAYASWWVV